MGRPETYLYVLLVLVNCCANCCRGVSSRSGVLEGQLATAPLALGHKGDNFAVIDAANLLWSVS